jgi:hypothetical protein
LQQYGSNISYLELQALQKIVTTYEI